MDHTETIRWAREMEAQGRKDAMGGSFTDWLVARHDEEGNALRDANGRQIFETQAEWLARNGAPIAAPAAPMQQALFA